MKIENLKAEYMDDKLTYEFLHNGKVVEGCIPKVHYRASFYDVQQVEETYDTNTTTSYTFTKGTNIEGLHIQVFLMDIVDGKTCVVESLIKLTVKNDWDGDLATTSLIPHIKTQTYVSLETNPNKEVAMQRDYELKAEYIDGGVTINVKHPGGEYVKKFDDIRQELFNKPIAVSKRNQTGYEETSYRLNWMTEPGFHLSMLVLDLENQCTGKIDLTYLKVYLITNEVNVIETGLIPHTSSSSTNPTGEQKMNKDSTQDKYHDGGSFADDENFHEEPIEPDTSPNGDLASLEAKVDELTELVKHQHRVITHMGNTMSILHSDLMRHMSHHHPATPYYPNFVPPEFGQHMPQPPLSPNGFGTTPPTHSFNPQQPPVGYYPPSGMGQGLYSNPSHQPDQPNNTSNSVLGQMNGLNQRLKAQQQPTATKEGIKDQARFWSNFLK